MKNDTALKLIESLQRIRYESAVNRKRSVFTTVKLSQGQTATVLDITGLDVFKASVDSAGNVGSMPYFLLVESTLIEGKKMGDFSDLDNLPACDVMAIMDVICVQITKTPQ